VSRFRRWGKGERTDADNVDLSEDEHAWWANGRVQSAPGLLTEPTPEPTPTPPSAPGPHEPWDFTDVFAADVDGAIDREFGEGTADGAQAADARNLAEVFAEESAYRALGVEPGATWDDVVTAHRRLAKRFHPDRLISADDQTRREGEQQMIEANAAYETLRQRLRPHSRTTGLFTS